MKNRIRNSDRELMQQALDALESVFEGDDKGAEYWTVTGGTYEAVECMQVMRALRARLAQPEPEPVAKMRELLEVQGCDGNWNFDPYMQGMFNGMEMMMSLVDGRDPAFRKAPDKWLYTAPPQREWKGLTDEEYEAMAENHVTNCYFDTLKYARAIEAKLKEKNGLS
jgi:hypothetical protein